MAKTKKKKTVKVKKVTRLQKPNLEEAKPKKRYLIKELTAFIESKGPDKVKFDECRKLAREIKPNTTYNETYHKILVARIKSNLKKSTPK